MLIQNSVPHTRKLLPCLLTDKLFTVVRNYFIKFQSIKYFLIRHFPGTFALQYIRHLCHIYTHILYLLYILLCVYIDIYIIHKLIFYMFLYLVSLIFNIYYISIISTYIERYNNTLYHPKEITSSYSQNLVYLLSVIHVTLNIKEKLQWLPSFSRSKKPFLRYTNNNCLRNDNA